MNVLMLAAHPPGRGSGSSARGAVTLAALRSCAETVHAASFALEGEDEFADPETLLVPRPGPGSVAARLAAPARDGSFFLDERNGQLAERMRSLIAAGRLLPRYDVVWAHSSLMAGAALDAFDARRRVLDIDNIAGAELLRRADGLPRLSPRRLYRVLDGRATAREERRRCAACDRVVVTSEQERHRLGPVGIPVSVVPNTVASTAAQVTPEEAAPRVLFIGSLHYEPNIDALEHLLADILPDVRRDHGELRMTVAGRDPTPAVTEMCRDAGVELVANAPSLEPLYRSARVVVAPMRLGGGTRVKLLEAMAYGAAIVATETAAEGLELEDGVNARVAGRAEGFARACSELLGDPQSAGRLGRAARETWHRSYRPEVAQRGVIAILEELRPASRAGGGLH